MAASSTSSKSAIFMAMAALFLASSAMAQWSPEQAPSPVPVAAPPALTPIVSEPVSSPPSPTPTAPEPSAPTPALPISPSISTPTPSPIYVSPFNSPPAPPPEFVEVYVPAPSPELGSAAVSNRFFVSATVVVGVLAAALIA